MCTRAELVSPVILWSNSTWPGTNCNKSDLSIFYLPTDVGLHKKKFTKIYPGQKYIQRAKQRDLLHSSLNIQVVMKYLHIAFWGWKQRYIGDTDYKYEPFSVPTKTICRNQPKILRKISLSSNNSSFVVVVVFNIY